MSTILPSSTHGAPRTNGYVDPAVSIAAEPAIHSTPKAKPNAAIGALGTLGQPRRRASADAQGVSRPIVVFSAASGDAASGPYNPAPYGAEVRARAVRELMAGGTAISKEDLAAKEEEIHNRQNKTDPNAQFTTHAPEAAVSSSTVSVPRAIAHALHAGLEGARHVVREAGFAPRTAWAV
jgi:hypothetical protein